jgi:hypothetical protein
MDNVLLGYHGGTDGGGDVSLCDGWTLPAVGEAVAYRIYMNADLNGTAGSSSHHPLQGGAGNVAFPWSIHFGVSNGDIDDVYMLHYYPPYIYLYPNEAAQYPGGEILILEWSFERVTSSTWRTRIKISDDAYVELDSVDMGAGNAQQLEDSASNGACGSSVAVRSWFVGWNGANWGSITGTIHWGGAAAAITEPGEWIGPYPVGPEAL